VGDKNADDLKGCKSSFPRPARAERKGHYFEINLKQAAARDSFCHCARLKRDSFVFARVKEMREEAQQLTLHFALSHPNSLSGSKNEGGTICRVLFETTLHLSNHSHLFRIRKNTPRSPLLPRIQMAIGAKSILYLTRSPN
jgi:hypothetical protein